MDDKIKKEDKMIKILLPAKSNDNFGGETVWAIERGVGRAEINNIPFFSKVGYKDLIRYKNIDGMNTYIETIVEKTESIGVEWQPTDENDKEQTTKEWHKISDYIASKNLDCESAMAGMFVISFPGGVTDKEILEITNNCPIALNPILGEDEE